MYKKEKMYYDEQKPWDPQEGLEVFFLGIFGGLIIFALIFSGIFTLIKGDISKPYMEKYIYLNNIYEKVLKDPSLSTTYLPEITELAREERFSENSTLTGKERILAKTLFETVGDFYKGIYILSKDNSAVNNIYLQATEGGLNLLRFELEIKD